MERQVRRLRLVVWLLFLFLLPPALVLSCNDNNNGMNPPDGGVHDSGIPSEGGMPEGGTEGGLPEGGIEGGMPEGGTDGGLPEGGTTEGGVTDGGVVIGPTYIGQVSTTSYFTLGDGGITTPHGVTASARFGLLSSNGLSCTTTSFGSQCVSTTCTGTPVSQTLTPQSAGPVTIQVLADGGASVVLQPADGGNYGTYFNSGNPLFTGGESVNVSWPGVAADGGVPAASNTMVAPNGVTILAPTPTPDGGTVSFSASAPATMAWTGGGAGTIHVVFISQVSDVVVQCDFPASGGTGMVPQGAMATLPQGQVAFLMLPQTFLAQTAGMFNFSISLINQPHNQDGSLRGLALTGDITQ